MHSSAQKALPTSVKRALRTLGNALRTARIRRRISTALMAERAFISRMTLNKIEKGDPGVAMGIYATVIFCLGMINKVADLIDISQDELGQALEEEQLPKRIRYPKTNVKKVNDE